MSVMSQDPRYGGIGMSFQLDHNLFDGFPEQRMSEDGLDDFLADLLGASGRWQIMVMGNADAVNDYIKSLDGTTDSMVAELRPHVLALRDSDALMIGQPS
jgi:hypothetical protein